MGLLALPNKVIDGVKVNSTTQEDEGVSFLVYFTGTSVQGPQNLLMVDVAKCGDGCTPKLTGVDVQTYGNDLSYVTEAAAAGATTTRACATASRATRVTSARSRPPLSE